MSLPPQTRWQASRQESAMHDQTDREQQPVAKAAPGKEGFVPPDLEEIARQFGMYRAAAYLRAMGCQEPVDEQQAG
jgi:hypothetical protein